MKTVEYGLRSYQDNGSSRHPSQTQHALDVLSSIFFEGKSENYDREEDPHQSRTTERSTKSLREPFSEVLKRELSK